MKLDIIDVNTAREIRADHAAITMAIAKNDSPQEIAAMQFALLFL